MVFRCPKASGIRNCDCMVWEPWVHDSPIVLAHEMPFSIGEATFWPASREVQLYGSRSIVEPKVMQLLVALHRASGGVVTKDELLEQCWNGRIIGDDAINRVVSRLRSVAEKQAGKQFRVETITKVGYRLASAKSGSPALSLVGKRPTFVHRVGRREMMVGGGFLGAVTMAGVGWIAPGQGTMPHEARVLVEDARNSLYQFTPDQIENAVGKLRRATYLAPESAEAWGLLSLAYVNASFNARPNQLTNLFARSEDCRRRAFAIEPYQPDALAAKLGTTRIFGNWDSQERGCREALRRHPDHPVLHVALGHLLLEVGRFEESLALFEASLRRTPLCVISHLSQIDILAGLGRFEAADAAVERAFALMPRQPAIWLTKLHYLSYTGRATQATAMIADSDSRPIGIPDWNLKLVAMHASALVTGDRARIRETLNAYGDAVGRGMHVAENAATFAAFVGDVDESFHILNAIYFNRGYKTAGRHWANEQGMYSGRERRTATLFRQPIAAIRRDLRFDRLTKDLGLDLYWERTRSRSKVVA